MSFNIEIPAAIRHFEKKHGYALKRLGYGFKKPHFFVALNGYWYVIIPRTYSHKLKVKAYEVLTQLNRSKH